MKFETNIELLAARSAAVKIQCKTEEATKHSLILPMIQALGYDIFDPAEVVPEVDCDIRHCGDKVDYVIQIGGSPQMIIECKQCDKNLDYFEDQLRSYFVGSSARIGVLTNGIEYRFYTDLDRTNLMDENPFLVVDMESIDNYGLCGLKMFCRDKFNLKCIMENADNLKCLNALRSVVLDEIADPSFELASYFAKRIYGQMPTKSVREKMIPLLKQVFGEVITSGGEYRDEYGDGITSEEQELVAIVSDILEDVVTAERISMSKGANYSTLRLDGCMWWPVVKFKLTSGTKWIVIGKYWPESQHFYGNLSEKIYIESVDDINDYRSDIRDVVTVMLMTDESERESWVTKHRSDWIN